MSVVKLDQVDFSNISVDNPNYHHILLYDWVEVSNYWDNAADFAPWIVNEPPLGASGEDGYAESSADFLYALLQGNNIADQVFSIIGYSRGGVVASELAQRMLTDGQPETDVAQVIFLDAEGGGASTEHSSADVWLYDDDEFWAWNGI